jgi:hypothetical protein
MNGRLLNCVLQIVARLDRAGLRELVSDEPSSPGLARRLWNIARQIDHEQRLSIALRADAAGRQPRQIAAANGVRIRALRRSNIACELGAIGRAVGAGA